MQERKNHIFGCTLKAILVLTLLLLSLESQAEGQTDNITGETIHRVSASFADNSIQTANHEKKTPLLQTGTTDTDPVEHTFAVEPSLLPEVTKHQAIQQQTPVAELTDKEVDNSIADGIQSSLLPEWLKQLLPVESSPAYIILGIVLFFFIMLWYFRNTEDEQDELELMSAQQQTLRDSPTDSREVNDSEPVSQYSSEIINDFPAEKKSHKNLLEAAYDRQNKNRKVTAFISIDNEDNKEIESSKITGDSSAYIEPSAILDSSAAIKNVHKNVRESKIQAFLKLTGGLTMTDEELAKEFDNIKNNQKIDVFIEEFEQIISTLGSHTPELENQSDDIENLMQFKLSVHFVKVLSEMMQARYLRYFSTTVIDYLEEVLNGQIVSSKDMNKRLQVVVSFYRQYVHSIKDKYKHQISA